MSIYNNNNKFISYSIVLIWLFVVFLFTKGQVISIYENLDLIETHSNTLDEKNTRLWELNTLKNSLVNSQKLIDKYNIEIKEDEIIDFIYSSIERTNDINGVSTVKNITISDPVKTELWFNQSLINISLRLPNEERLKEIINIFISDTSKYKFYINSFNFPYWDNSWNFNVSLPLVILHK